MKKLRMLKKKRQKLKKQLKELELNGEFKEAQVVAEKVLKIMEEELQLFKKIEETAIFSSDGENVLIPSELYYLD
jgi:hypothetical protein